ncbi:MAG: hypothetical protein AB8C84_12000 [Oligoflexales bacterium]
MFKKIAVLLLWFPSVVLFSHPMTLGDITGENLSLKTIQHSFAGSIKNRIVMGHKIQGQFVSELRILENDQEVVSVFQAEAGEKFGGVFTTSENGIEKAHNIQFIKIIKEEDKYIMSFDGVETSVFVNAESFQNGHFVNPEYSMDLNGEHYSFRLEGQACYGYSLHLISMIMSALVY